LEGNPEGDEQSERTFEKAWAESGMFTTEYYMTFSAMLREGTTTFNILSPSECIASFFETGID
jgi:hypothetical protein